METTNNITGKGQSGRMDKEFRTELVDLNDGVDARHPPPVEGERSKSMSPQAVVNPLALVLARRHRRLLQSLRTSHLYNSRRSGPSADRSGTSRCLPDPPTVERATLRPMPRRRSGSWT